MPKGYKLDGSFAGKVFVKGNPAPKTAFKLGNPAPKTAFKKGHIAWNKGIKGLNLGHPNYLKLQTNEAREKISKNNARYWKGKKLPSLSLIVRRKISESLKGEKAPNWQGGKTALRIMIRESFEYNLWRKAIFERDDYTCQLCWIKGGKLHVDHYPKTFAQILREYNIQSLEDAINCEALWDIKNNRTLCESCHKLTPSYLNSNYLRKEFKPC